MRKPTGEEADKWVSIAREHGFVGEGGSFKLGRFIVEGSEEDAIIYVQFVTPVPAGIYTEGTVEPKAPPVVFERTSAGEIILPGRWWASMFETLSGQPEVPPDQRQTALFASRHVQAGDVHLPAETDTIEILAPNHKGDIVPHEALKPGTRCIISIRAS